MKAWLFNLSNPSFILHPSAFILALKDGTLGRRRLQTLFIALAIFAFALGVRFLVWQDNQLDARQVQWAVTDSYKHLGRLLLDEGWAAFFNPSSPVSDPFFLGHPPGYSFLWSIVFSLFNEPDGAMQVVQAVADAASAVLVFLLAACLLPRRVAAVAGMLVALSPQFAYNSILLLPDSLAVLPVLLSVYLLARARERPRMMTFLLAGALVGISCWLRANAMLLAPFLAALTLILYRRDTRRLRFALALLAGTILAIAPLTLRNAIVFGHFIPISLGAGQTMIEGIADYDEDGSLGMPKTDLGVMRLEAKLYNRPDYFGALFVPDGVKRDRLRLGLAWDVIRRHPFWFAGVMARRATMMLRLERVRAVAAEPSVTRSPFLEDDAQPVWSGSATQVTVSAGESAAVRLRAEGQTLDLHGDNERFDKLVFPLINVERNTDYVFRVPVKVERGRVVINITSSDGQCVHASTHILQPLETLVPGESQVLMVELPFVSRATESVRVILSKGDARAAETNVKMGEMSLYRLGPASHLWTRYPRVVIRLLQKFFLTAWMLPLVILGLVLLGRAGRYHLILLLLVVPLYYVSVQSALHTEYRYVLAIYYFLYVAVAVALCQMASLVWGMAHKFLRSRSGAINT